MLQTLSSSLRERELAQTLQIAIPFAKRLGVSRVTDITRLDRIGIPVFASIRPTAAPGSLCVHAGKGLSELEAQVGATMEAIEFAMAEVDCSRVAFTVSTIRELEESFGSRFDLVDLCPLYGRSFHQADRIAAVNAAVCHTGRPILLPAELVFMPTFDLPSAGLFSGSTNGLCSGNTIIEARIHGVLELMERDTLSMNYVHDESCFVVMDGAVSDDLNEALRLIDDAGLEVTIRYTKSPFDFPYFEAYICEPDDDAPVAIASGFGLHPVRRIALVRAITEAAQGRLSHIHGGRDDIIRRHRLRERRGIDNDRVAVRQFIKRITDISRKIQYQEISDFGQFESLDDVWSLIQRKLDNVGAGPVLQVVFTSKSDPIQVLKMIIPKLEHFEADHQRVGRRLMERFRDG
ncbi:YcaO-like family protein [Caballeronia sordidicola]|nr:YcaO-like family protein [Caballeronia sordidicola]